MHVTSVTLMLQCVHYACLVQGDHETDVFSRQHDDAKGALQEALVRFVSYIMPHMLLHMPSTVKQT